MSDDVVAFLRAAHEHMERVAGAAERRWARWDPTMSERSAHIALNDPQSALARVQAERAIVDQLSRMQTVWFVSDQPGANEAARQVAKTIAEATFRLLAYGHRHTVPGWREEWAPEGVTADA